MLAKLREQLREELRKRHGTLNAEEFLPFLNERDSVGRVIRPTRRYSIIQPEEILQSLKMTTQEFFSRKKFKKDLHRFNLLKRSLNPKEMDYEAEASRCEQMISGLEAKTNESNLNSQLFYDVDRRTTERVEQLRNTLAKESLSKQRKQVESQQKKREKKNKENNLSRSVIRPVKTEIFREVDRNGGATQSEFMANWTRCSVPYRQQIQNETKKPERSNYSSCVHRIFLGREVRTKQPKRLNRTMQA